MTQSNTPWFRNLQPGRSGMFIFAVFLIALLCSPAYAGSVNAGRGPVDVHVPPSYDGSVPAPLVVNLHGYSVTGPEQEAYFQLTPLADEFGFLYVYPTGNTDFLGNPFWNATDACCDIFGGTPNDSAYLLNLVNTIKANYSVDPRRVYFTGHSNGGFMSYRFACDHADTVAAIASLAGATWENPNLCGPANNVDVLQIHGTDDGVIGYNGGFTTANYPGAIETVEQWATFNGCSLVPDFSPPNLNLDSGLAGAESTVRRYNTDCGAGGSTELWTIVNGVHSPSLTPAFSRGIIEFFMAHPKPAEFGTVNGGSGAVQPVLFIDGNTGATTIPTGQTFSISLAAATLGPANPRYSLWIWTGSSSSPVEMTASGTSLGCTVNPTPVTGGSPQPFRCLRSPSLPNALCQGVTERTGPVNAPFAITVNNGLQSPREFWFQALIQDDGAANPFGYSLSNAVFLNITP